MKANCNFWICLFHTVCVQLSLGDEVFIHSLSVSCHFDKKVQVEASFSAEFFLEYPVRYALIMTISSLDYFSKTSLTLPPSPTYS